MLRSNTDLPPKPLGAYRLERREPYLKEGTKAKALTKQIIYLINSKTNKTRNSFFKKRNRKKK